jgi:putative spermidine/putrescine transport system substrate-binding protein
MTIRTLLAVALYGIVAASPVWGRPLTVASAGNPLEETLRTIYFAPFTQATGIPVSQAVWPGGVAILGSRVATGTNDWDLVQVAPDDLLNGCAGGLYEKVDWKALGGQDHYLPQGVSDCGVGAFITTAVLAWDRDKFQGTPTWADFWDVAKYPGKRGLRRGVKMTLEIALMADGVAPGDVYKTLRTDEGVDRAFHKLDQLKPYLTWWQSGADAAKLLATGQVLMTSAPSSEIVDWNETQGRHFGIQWAGNLSTVDSWAVMKGSPNAADAFKLLTFMGDPVRQTAFAAATHDGVLAKGATEKLTPEQLAVSPGNAANLTQGLQVDESFWHDNFDKLSLRFDTWLAH